MKKCLKNFIPLFLVTFFLFCFSSTVKASGDYTSVSFGDANSNGCFTAGATYNGAPIYSNGTNYILRSNTINRWIVATNTSDLNDSSLLYYGADTGGGGYLTTPDLSGWTPYHGASPGGTLTSSSCGGGGGGGGGGSTTTTSTIISLNADTENPFIYFFGILIFVLFFWIGREV